MTSIGSNISSALSHIGRGFTEFASAARDKLGAGMAAAGQWLEGGVQYVQTALLGSRSASVAQAEPDPRAAPASPDVAIARGAIGEVARLLGKRGATVPQAPEALEKYLMQEKDGVTRFERLFDDQSRDALLSVYVEKGRTGLVQVLTGSKGLGSVFGSALQEQGKFTEAVAVGRAIDRLLDAVVRRDELRVSSDDELVRTFRPSNLQEKFEGLLKAELDRRGL